MTHICAEGVVVDIPRAVLVLAREMKANGVRNNRILAQRIVLRLLQLGLARLLKITKPDGD